ncbi:MAG: hypothetical protein LBM39_02975, partial [Candidatus Methanoplasma sp.]|nr:hypothetical protein [Candidatus Methanoplasma sp.]
MTKRIPEKREQKRAYKLEQSEQARQMKAIQMIVDGRTFREAAAAVDRSTGSVREWVGKCLQKHGKR